MRVGISSCLLGKNVRWNGGHKLFPFLRDDLGHFVEWIPVCPEVEIDLPIPREPLHLLKTDNELHLIARKSKTDYTETMLQWSLSFLRKIESENLCGFVLKSLSPSCGTDRVKIYNSNGNLLRANGTGLFAKRLSETFPQLPIIDDGRINNGILREHFIQNIFTVDRWNTCIQKDRSLSNLITFHTNHKLLLMAHSPANVSRLDIVIANNNLSESEKISMYYSVLLETIRIPVTRNRNADVLLYCFNYLSERLSSFNRKELLVIIHQYHKGIIPLIVPIMLVRHYVSVFSAEHLKNQTYLNPYPDELMLRNTI